MLAFRRPASLPWRARRLALSISAGGLLAPALLSGAAPPAGAAPAAPSAPSARAAATVAFHGYSVFEIQLSGVVSSLSVTRPDKAVHVAGSSGCKVKFAGTPAYQTEWIGAVGGNWVELGTGHQCQGYQYWYAGHGQRGTWFPQWTKVTTTDASHRFWIHGSKAANGNKTFTFNIGTNRYATVQFSLTSHIGETGLESYASATKVPAYSMTALKYSNGFGTAWHPWTGTTAVAPNSPLCGRKVSATHVVSGENVQCRATAPSAVARTRRPASGPAVRGARPAASTPASATACQHAARTWGANAVTRSYQDTAGAVRAWRETRSPAVRPTYPLLSRAATAPVAVCYLSGSFAGIPAAPGYTTRYRRLIVIVSESTGAMTLDAAGHAATWSFAPPFAR